MPYNIRKSAYDNRLRYEYSFTRTLQAGEKGQPILDCVVSCTKRGNANELNLTITPMVLDGVFKMYNLYATGQDAALRVKFFSVPRYNAGLLSRVAAAVLPFLIPVCAEFEKDQYSAETTLAIEAMQEAARGVK